MHLIYLNDWLFSCFDQDLKAIYQQPCAANMAGSALCFGETALRCARSAPQTFASNYLSRLGDEALPQAMGPALNQADLLYHQLKHIAETHDVAECVVCVPTHMADHQLGLFLGVADAAGIQPMGFVDSALVYATAANANANDIANPSLVLDLGLHAALLSICQVEQGRVSTLKTRALDDAGLLPIVNSWLYDIADRFIAQTRFDPLHSATSEQALFDEVMTWVERGELPRSGHVELDAEQFSRRIEIQQDRLLSRLLRKLQALQNEAASAIVIHAKVAAMPHFINALQQLDLQIIPISDRQFAAAGYQIAKSLTTGEQPERLIANVLDSVLDNVLDQASPTADSVVATRPNGARSESSGDEAQLAAPATHLLKGAQAVPLDAPEFADFLDADGLIKPGAKLLVDASTPSSARLREGQAVSLNGEQWLAIRIS